jgi:hypothetical protein
LTWAKFGPTNASICSVGAGLAQPPGSPPRAPSGATKVGDKLAACGPDVPVLVAGAAWESAGELLRTTFPHNKEAAA